MHRPATSLIAQQIQSMRDQVKARYEAMSPAEQAAAQADYRKAAENGQRLFHPLHTVFA
jgi:hypothetical protein